MAVIGSAFVEIRALTTKLDSDISKAFGKNLDKIGKDAGTRLGSAFASGFKNALTSDDASKSGKDYAESFGKGLSSSASSAFQDFVNKLRNLGKNNDIEVQARLGGSFEDDLRSRIRAAQQALPAIDIEASADGVEDVIARVRAELGELSDVKIGIDMDADSAITKAAQVKADLESLKDKVLDINVRTDVDKATATLEAWLKSVDGRAVDIPVHPGFGGAFEEELQTRFKAAAASLPDIPAKLNSAGVDGDIAAIRQKLAALGDARIGIDMPLEQFLREMAEVEAAIRELSGKDIEIDAKVNLGSALTQIEALKQEINSVGDSADNLSGIGGGGGLFSGLLGGDSANQAGQAMRRVALEIDGAASVAATAIGSFSALGSSLFSLAAAAAPAAQSLIVLPSIIGAVVQAAGTVGAAFQGIGGAVKAGMQQQLQAGASSATAAKQQQASATAIRDANERLSDVYSSNAEAAKKAAQNVVESQNNVKKVVEDNADSSKKAARAVADAQQSLQNTYTSSSRAIQNAQEQVTSSQEDYNKALEAEKKAQQDVSKARDSAIEDMQQLGFQVRQSAIDEKEATLEVKRARDNLAKYTELPANNALRQDAQNQYDQAVLNLEEATDKQKDLTAEQKASAEAGVEGSAKVVDAKQKEADATQNVLDAQQKITDAQQGLADAQTKAQQDIAKANRDVADAMAEQQKTARDNADRLAKAQQAVSDSLDAQQKTARENAKALRDAQEAVSDAMKRQADATGTAAGAVDKYALAMKNLSPQAQEFVRYLLSIQTELRAVRNAAGEELFPALESSLKTIIGNGMLNDLADGLRKTGGAVGSVALGFAALTNDPFFRGNFNTVMSNNAGTITTLGVALNNLIGYFTALLAAAGPVTDRFTKFVVSITAAQKASLDTGSEVDAMSGKFQHAGDIAAQLGRIFKNTIDGILALGKDAAPAGQGLLDSLENLTKKFSELNDNAGRSSALKDFFTGAATNARAVLELFGKIALGLLALGDNKGIKETADSLRTNLVPILGELANNGVDKVGPVLAENISKIAGAFNQLSKTGALESFISTLGTLADIISSALSNPVIGPVIADLAKFEAVLAALALIRNFTGISYLGTAIGGIAKTAVTGLSGIKNFAAGVSAASGAASGGLSFTQKLSAGLSNMGPAGVKASNALSVVSKAASATGKGVATAANAFLTFSANAVKAGATAVASASKTVAMKTAAIAVAAAQKVQAGAQAALNVVMDANPIGLIVLAVAALTVGFIELYKHSETFRKILSSIGDAAKNVGGFLADLGKNILDGLVKAITDPKVILDGVTKLFHNFVDFFKNLFGIHSPSTVMAEMGGYLVDGLVQGIQGIGSKIGDAFGAVKDAVVSGVGAALDFVKSNWPLLLAILTGPLGLAVLEITKHWDDIKNIVSAAVDGIKGFFSGLCDGVSSGLSAAKDVVVSIWNNIVGFVQGIPGVLADVGKTLWSWITAFLNSEWQGLQVIWGWITGFVTGIGATLADAGKAIWSWITGNLALEWVGVQVVWGYVVDFVTGIGDTIKAVGLKIWSWITENLSLEWAGLQIIWGYVVDFVTGLPSRIATAAAGIWDFITNAMTAAYNWIVDQFNAVVSVVSGLDKRIGDAFGDAFHWIREKISDASNWVSDRFNDIIGFVLGLTKRVGDAIGDPFHWIRDKAWDMGTFVSDRFHDIVQFVIDLPGNIGRVIGDVFKAVRDKAGDLRTDVSNIFSGIKDDVHNIFNLVPSATHDGIQGIRNALQDHLIANMNKVTSKFGLTIPDLPNIPQFATGGYVSGPGGPKDDKVPALLSNGEFVINAKTVAALGRSNLAALNAGKKGLSLGGVGSAIGGAAKSTSNFVLGAYKEVKQVTSGLFGKALGLALRKLIEPVVNMIPQGLWVGDMSRSILGKFEDSVETWGTNQKAPADSASPGGKYDGPIPTGEAVTRWTGLVSSTLAELGLSNTPDMINRVLRQIKTESGGNPNATQGNIGDVNNKSGDLARGLMQVIGATFRAFAGPYKGLGQYDPHASIYAGLNYAKKRYGPSLSFLGQGHGYDSGGIASGTGFLPKMTIKPERVLSPRQTQSFDRLVDMLGSVPAFASGGTVKARAGGQLAMVAEAGMDERITPLDRNGLSAGDRQVISSIQGLASNMQGNTVHLTINPPADMDVATLARLVQREITWNMGN